MPRKAHHAEKHERNCPSGENPCTSHGINSLWNDGTTGARGGTVPQLMMFVLGEKWPAKRREQEHAQTRVADGAWEI
mgnify:FL=1